MSRFDATGQGPVDKWTAAPRLTTSPQANHNNRSGQLIWYINRSNQNVLDMNRYMPTALVGLADAERLCDRLNARLGLDREVWCAIVGRSMAAARGDAPLH